MNKFALFSVAFCCSWMASTTPPAQALCLNRDAELTLARDPALDDTEFVNSSPARSDSEFKLEVNLSELGSTRPQDEAETEQVSNAAPLPAAALEAPPPGEGMAEDGSAATLSGDGLGGLDETVISLEDQPIEPRADFLADFADAFNTCSEP